MSDFLASSFDWFQQMSKYHIFLWVVILILSAIYIIAGLMVMGNYKSIRKMDEGDLSAKGGYNREEFIRSMNSNSRDTLNVQKWIMVGLTIVFALFDSQYYVMASMGTLLVATSHYYFLRNMN